jgi:CHASE2 domain-containing sensor protein
MSKHETLDNLSSLQKIILVVSVAMIGIGASGMVVSLRYMAIAGPRYVAAAAAVFIGSAIFVAGGLIATAVISTVHTV